MSDTNRIWIELPSAETIEERREVCAKANRMMNKLDVRGEVFAPNETKAQRTEYVHISSECGSFTELSDNGQWFNLGFLGIGIAHPVEEETISCPNCEESWDRGSVGYIIAGNSLKASGGASCIACEVTE